MIDTSPDITLPSTAECGVVNVSTLMPRYSVRGGDVVFSESKRSGTPIFAGSLNTGVPMLLPAADTKEHKTRTAMNMIAE
ncbi:MAG: hypothetical protein LBV40_00640 [Methanomicrobiales archaeon]|nr:hypothetical protein [Methanomicrobiales archaeon]